LNINTLSAFARIRRDFDAGGSARHRDDDSDVAIAGRIARYRMTSVYRVDRWKHEAVKKLVSGAEGPKYDK
jgi:hypothetical protein